MAKAKTARAGKGTTEQRLLTKLGDAKLVTAYHELRELYAKTSVDGVKHRRAMGVVLARIEKDFPDDGARKIIDALGWAYAEACHYLRCAQTFTDSDIDELMALRSPTGMSLTWGHIKASLRVEDDERRRKLLHHAVEANLTVLDLEAKIRDEKPKKKKKGSGPSFKVPKSLAAGVHMLNNQTDGWLRRQADIFDPYVISRLAGEIPIDDIDDKLINSVSETRQLLESMVEQAAEDVKALKSAEKRLKDIQTAAKARMRDSETQTARPHAAQTARPHAAKTARPQAAQTARPHAAKPSTNGKASARAKAAAKKARAK